MKNPDSRVRALTAQVQAHEDILKWVLKALMSGDHEKVRQELQSATLYSGASDAKNICASIAKDALGISAPAPVSRTASRYQRSA